MSSKSINVQEERLKYRISRLKNLQKKLEATDATRSKLYTHTQLQGSAASGSGFTKEKLFLFSTCVADYYEAVSSLLNHTIGFLESLEGLQVVDQTVFHTK